MVLTAARVASSPSGQLCLAKPLPKPQPRQGVYNSLRSPYLNDNFFVHTIVTRWEHVLMLPRPVFDRLQSSGGGFSEERVLFWRSPLG